VELFEWLGWGDRGKKNGSEYYWNILHLCRKKCTESCRIIGVGEKGKGE
jgi:hypothetical protein